MADADDATKEWVSATPKQNADGNVIPHEEKEELNEGKMPEGLKNYLMKKKGKKEDQKEDMKREGADLSSEDQKSDNDSDSEQKGKE